MKYRLLIYIISLLTLLITLLAVSTKTETTETYTYKVIMTPEYSLYNIVETPKSLGIFKLTAYCGGHCCNGKWAGKTSTGVKPIEGITIAVDPKIIPYGTEVYINGQVYIAQDCGGLIKNKRIDVYFESHEEALEFGVKYADVYEKE